MLSLPLSSYLFLAAVTLLVLLAKDRLILMAYKGRRPNRLSNGSEDLVGYVSTHWAVTVLVLFSLELLYRNIEGGRGTTYGFIVACMEATIRVTAYLLTPSTHVHKRGTPSIMFRFNYLFTSVLAVGTVMFMDWFHV